MQHKSFAESECPIARTIEHVGEWWSLLILRDAFRGRRRFDEFQESLGIARNILSRRLKRLVADGLLEKRLYEARPARYEYRLTQMGRDLFPVLTTLLVWGNRWAPPAGGPALIQVDRDTGQAIEAALIDARTGHRIDPRRVRLAAGPGAGPETLTLLAQMRKE
jgi:DNA-binding HxlR family transcriptional regulator